MSVNQYMTTEISPVTADTPKDKPRSVKNEENRPDGRPEGEPSEIIKKDEQDTTTTKVSKRKNSRNRSMDNDKSNGDGEEEEIEVGYNAAKKRQRQELTKGKTAEELRQDSINDLKALSQYKDSLADDRGKEVNEYEDGL